MWQGLVCRSLHMHSRQRPVCHADLLILLHSAPQPREWGRAQHLPHQRIHGGPDLWVGGLRRLDHRSQRPGGRPEAFRFSSVNLTWEQPSYQVTAGTGSALGALCLSPRPRTCLAKHSPPARGQRVALHLKALGGPCEPEQVQCQQTRPAWAGLLSLALQGGLVRCPELQSHPCSPAPAKPFTSASHGVRGRLELSAAP